MDDPKTRLAEIVDELDDLTLELAHIDVADRDELGVKAVQVEQAAQGGPHRQGPGRGPDPRRR